MNSYNIFLMFNFTDTLIFYSLFHYMVIKPLRQIYKYIKSFDYIFYHYFFIMFLIIFNFNNINFIIFFFLFFNFYILIFYKLVKSHFEEIQDEIYWSSIIPLWNIIILKRICMKIHQSNQKRFRKELKNSYHHYLCLFHIQF